MPADFRENNSPAITDSDCWINPGLRVRPHSLNLRLYHRVSAVVPPQARSGLPAGTAPAALRVRGTAGPARGGTGAGSNRISSSLKLLLPRRSQPERTRSRIGSFTPAAGYAGGGGPGRRRGGLLQVDRHGASDLRQSLARDRRCRRPGPAGGSPAGCRRGAYVSAARLRVAGRDSA